MGKQKQHLAHFAAACYQGSMYPSAAPAPSPGATLSITASSPHCGGLSHWVCEHLYFISVYTLHPLARWAYSNCFFAFGHFSLRERFHRNTLLSQQGKSVFKLKWVTDTCNVLFEADLAKANFLSQTIQYNKFLSSSWLVATMKTYFSPPAND